ncbi:MAG TPA: hypothetical protein VI542_13690 [Candidatus Tectomicrobia bacterium]
MADAVVQHLGVTTFCQRYGNQLAREIVFNAGTSRLAQSACLVFDTILDIDHSLGAQDTTASDAASHSLTEHP